jgi:beta-D-xylosidase 4
MLAAYSTAVSDFTGHNSKCKPNCPIGHNYSASNISAVAAAMAGGTDTNCGTPNFYQKYLGKAVADGLVPPARVDSAFRRVALMILRLGLLDLDTPFDRLGKTDVGAAATDTLCVEAARQSVVLLANRGGVVLPLALPRAEAASLALIGPHANTTTELLGMYVGAGNQLITQRSARAVLGSRLRGRQQLEYAPGLPSLASADTSGFAAAVAAAERSHTTVVMLGLCEQGHGCTEHENQDRSTLGLPQPQLALLQAVSAAAATASATVVCVFVSGGPLSVDALDALCDAALWSGYPGQAGAIGIVDVLLGAAAPTGVLPYTLHCPRPPGAVKHHYRFPM